MKEVVLRQEGNFKVWTYEEEDKTQYDIVHYIGPTGKLPVYRRNKLNDYLNKHFKVKTYRIGDNWDLVNKPTLGIIVSAPQGSEFLKDIDCPVYYDRTDYWSADIKYQGMEDWLLEKAKVITCSSKYLAEITPNGIRIDNGANVIKLKKVYKEPIAVYVGKEDKKIDLDVCKKWKEEHPELRFVSIGREIEGFEYIPLMPHDKMMRFLAKCKVGLIPLKQTEYCKGQFNLKYWDYKQAGLEVWTTIDYNYQDCQLTYWEDVCREIVKCYGM